jgi:putative transport protein
VFAETLRSGGGLGPFVAGLVVTVAISASALYVGRRWMRIPMGVLVGMIAGIQTQPAVLAFGVEQTKDDLPNTGYAAVFPVATIAKIVLAQVLVWAG